MDRDQFLAAALTNPVNDAITRELFALALPDAWLVSGCLVQSVWNALTGRAAGYGINDYDVFYFDPDTTWEAEDAVIRRIDARLATLGVTIETRNQARVHLWYAAIVWIASSLTPIAMTRLAHHAGGKSRAAARRFDLFLQEAMRFLADIAGPGIGPGAALVVGGAGSLAGLVALALHVKILVVAAGPVDRVLLGDTARLDHARAAHARDATGVLHPRRHIALQPAHRSDRGI